MTIVITVTIMTTMNIRCLIIPAVLNGIWAFINFTKVPSTPEEFGYVLHFNFFFMMWIIYNFTCNVGTGSIEFSHWYFLIAFLHSTQHNSTLSNTTPHRTTQRRIETENSRAAAEKASRGIAEDAKAPIGFIEVRKRSKSRKNSDIRDKDLRFPCF